MAKWNLYTALTTVLGNITLLVRDDGQASAANEVRTVTPAVLSTILGLASTAAKGTVELATAAEITTGTDSTRAMPVDQFVTSSRNVEYFVIRCVRNDSDLPADATLALGGATPIPYAGTITEIFADVDTAGTTGTQIVDVNLNGTTIMTTNKLKWDSTEKSTRTYSGTAPGLTTTAIAAGDLITVDIDTNHTTKAKGLVVTLGIRKT
jgi:hypothetical protein